jgi:hypothetical protein
MKTEVEAVKSMPPPVPPADAPAASGSGSVSQDTAIPASDPVRISRKAIAGMLCTITGILMLLGGLLLWRPTGVRVQGAASPQLHFETIKPD